MEETHDFYEESWRTAARLFTTLWPQCATSGVHKPAPRRAANERPSSIRRKVAITAQEKGRTVQHKQR